MKFHQFNPPCDEINVALFDNLKLPQYRTVDVVGIKELDVDSINFKNSNGQIINLARSTGTDKDNVNCLKESLVNWNQPFPKDKDISWKKKNLEDGIWEEVDKITYNKKASIKYNKTALRNKERTSTIKEARKFFNF